MTVTLEIKVRDEIKVFDSVEKAEEYVFETIRNWYESEEQSPLTITLSKIADRGPPTLSVVINESIKTKDVLR